MLNRLSQPAHQRGFTLLELITVLGIVGALASIILPNVGVTYSSQMREAISDFANAARATYDSAILESRIHRLVLKPKTGQYFTEIAPVGFEGRPALTYDVDPREQDARAETRARLLEELEHEAAEPRNSKEDEKRSYAYRSILVAKRSMLKPVPWTEVSDALLSHRALPGKVVFASTVTEEMREPLEFSAATENDTIYIYFFPSGQTQMASVQLGMQTGDRNIDDKGPKYTLNLDPLSGQSEVIEGFVEAEFVKQRK